MKSKRKIKSLASKLLGLSLVVALFAVPAMAADPVEKEDYLAAFTDVDDSNDWLPMLDLSTTARVQQCYIDANGNRVCTSPPTTVQEFIMEEYAAPERQRNIRRVYAVAPMDDWITRHLAGLDGTDNHSYSLEYLATLTTSQKWAIHNRDHAGAMNSSFAPNNFTMYSNGGHFTTLGGGMVYSGTTGRVYNRFGRAILFDGQGWWPLKALGRSQPMWRR